MIIFLFLCTLIVHLLIWFWDPRTSPPIWMHILIAILHPTLGNTKNVPQHTMSDTCACKKLVSNPIHVGTSYHKNAHGVIITKKFEHSSCRSFESKPTLREKRGLRWRRKPPFPCSITVLCAFKAHRCHSKFSNWSFACWTSLPIIKDFSKASAY